MSVLTREYPQFFYVKYNREGYQDLEDLKREFGNFTGLSATPKDVAVDLTGSSYITSPEIGALVRLMMSLQKVGCSVMLIAPPAIKKFLYTTNLHKSPNLEIYEDHKQFAEVLQKTKYVLPSKGPKPPLPKSPPL
jgi:anti-anti-sigma regulatory factor